MKPDYSNNHDNHKTLKDRVTWLHTFWSCISNVLSIFSIPLSLDLWVSNLDLVDLHETTSLIRHVTTTVPPRTRLVNIMPMINPAWKERLYIKGFVNKLYLKYKTAVTCMKSTKMCEVRFKCDRLCINRPFTQNIEIQFFASSSYQPFADNDDFFLHTTCCSQVIRR